MDIDSQLMNESEVLPSADPKSLKIVTPASCSPFSFGSRSDMSTVDRYYEPVMVAVVGDPLPFNRTQVRLFCEIGEILVLGIQ